MVSIEESNAPVAVVRLTVEALLGRRAELAAIYRAVFTGPPYHESELDVQWFGRALNHHVQRDGFRAVGAFAGADEAGPHSGDALIGFAFGATGKAGEGWYDMLRARLPEDVAEAWMASARGWPFELMELAVLPAWQGRGIGGGLHDALLAGLPHPTALLTTAAAATAATHLYRDRGWVRLTAPFTLPGGDVRFVLLGLRLMQAQRPGTFK